MEVLATLVAKLAGAGRYLRDEVLHVHPSWTGRTVPDGCMPPRYDSDAAWPELAEGLDESEDDEAVPAFNPASGELMMGPYFDARGNLYMTGSPRID